MTTKSKPETTVAQRRREAEEAYKHKMIWGVELRLEQRAAAERRQVGGPDSLVQRVERGEEERPWWM